MDNKDKVISGMVESANDILSVQKDLDKLKMVSRNNRKILNISKYLGDIATEVYTYDQPSGIKLIEISCSILNALDGCYDVSKQAQKRVDLWLDKIEGNRIKNGRTVK